MGSPGANSISDAPPSRDTPALISVVAIALRSVVASALSVAEFASIPSADDVST